MNHIDSLSIPIDGELRHDFIVDCARFAEGILTERAVKKKYRFDDDTWERLGSDEADRSDRGGKNTPNTQWHDGA